ncbi:MAG: serine/threonine protein kinase [Planctomycetota bacterium]|nr:serine/threonine protein kinase [Planctomycetota bacterium]
MVLGPEDDLTIPAPTFEERIYNSHGIEILRHIAEGGMGVVYEASQPELDRRVALKILREDCRDRAVVREHFIEEARVSGRLQHPGVLPVYVSGIVDDRPFFTMRLIEGLTLADLLASGASRETCLEHFHRVCQTVAYAHSLGIVHRDLKPGNVLVGDFGETMVVDWGLAAVAGDGGPDADARAGTVVGTPAYMSPEQARGEADRMDRRGDVFGLGALLCEILTGRPPYVGDSEEIVRQKARSGDTGEALSQIATSDADEALRALATACLATDPDRRPRDAGAVALAMDAHQAGVQARIKAADQARWRAEVRAVEERKRWGLVLLVLAVCTAAGFWWISERSARSRREAEAGRSLAEALDEASRLRVQGRTEESRAAVRKVEGLLALLGEPGRRRYSGRVADLEMLARLDDARYLPAQAGPGRLLHVQAASAYADAFRRYGMDPEAQPGQAGERARSSAIRDDLAAALDDWARATTDPARKRRLREVADAADPEPGRFAARLRRALGKADRAALDGLARAVRVEDHPASSLVALGAGLRAAGALDEAVELLRAAQLRHPGDFWINLELASALAVRGPGDRAESDAFLTAALALSRRNPGAFFYLGSALHDLGRLGPAIDAYRRAIAARPDYAEAYCNLGNALTAQKKIDEAVAAFRSAIANRPGYALAYFNLGYALDERERFEESAESYAQAVRSRPDYAEAYCNLGLAEYRLGRFSAASADLTRGLALLPASEPLRSYWGQVEGLARSLAALEPRLAGVIGGGPVPSDVKDVVGLARLCAWRNRRLYLRATRLYQAAFAALPSLAEDLVVGDRYAAAGSAAMAGCGRGEDASGSSETERSELRSLALGWLRADLTRRARQIEQGDARAKADARLRLLYWLRDPNFEAVRGVEAIDRLPEPERAAWKALWSDLMALAPPLPVRKT